MPRSPSPHFTAPDSAQLRHRPPRPLPCLLARPLRANPPRMSSSMARTIHTPPTCSRRHGNPNFPETNPSLVFSAVAAKDIAGILEILAPLASRIFLCPVDTPRAVSAEELAAHLPARCAPHETFASFQAAFAAARQHDEPDPHRRLAFPRRRGAGVSNEHNLPAKFAMTRKTRQATGFTHSMAAVTEKDRPQPHSAKTPLSPFGSRRLSGKAEYPAPMSTPSLLRISK